MKTALVLAALLAATPALAQQTVIRDAGGRTIGTASRDSQGTTVFRDSRGSTTGTASPSGSGTTTFRDASGRTTGTTTTAPRR